MYAQDCPTGKSGIQHRKSVDGIAKAFARELNRMGRFVNDLYTYRCAECHRWHLTRRKSWKGQDNELVHTAAPRELQQWAMPQAIDANLTGDQPPAVG